jgi:hypothetical protein
MELGDTPIRENMGRRTLSLPANGQVDLRSLHLEMLKPARVNAAPERKEESI